VRTFTKDSCELAGSLAKTDLPMCVHGGAAHSVLPSQGLTLGSRVGGDGVASWVSIDVLSPRISFPESCRNPKTFGCSGGTWTRKTDGKQKYYIGFVFVVVGKKVAAAGVEAWPGAWQ